MKGSLLFRYTLVTCLSLFLLMGCLDDVRYKMPCRTPAQVEETDLIGAWQLTYKNYRNPDSPSTKVTGVEVIHFYADNSYVQTFHSTDFSFESSKAKWELVTHEGDGPKVVMHDLKYFANGIEYSNRSLTLSLQMFDQLSYQEKYSREQRTAKTVVAYPADGFVYLYPRSCLWKFVLLQMVSGVGDPDDLTVHNPVFTKVEE